MDKNESYLTATKTANSLGVTVKALRVYERQGLLEPLRTQAGWRIYGPEHIETIAKIIALKSVGLRLIEIKDMLNGAMPMADILAEQGSRLTKQAAVIDNALSIIKHAENILSTGNDLSTDMLVKLVRKSSQLHPWTEENEMFAQKYFTVDQMKFYQNLKTSSKGQEKIHQAWGGLIEEVEVVLGKTLTKAQAKSLVRRWKDAMSVFTKNDPALELATMKWFEEGYSDPNMTERMPFPQPVWRFMNELMKNHETNF